ncbi:MAG: 1,4-dihydroxy-2-naphthoate octaprenyltransferase [Candidatus Hydrogenedentes bacterium]|nr:1,4-dihydroxy-2-naphthoate octaprenyltransferase [Candidatus Hydrogenedentota bacterium]
MITSISSKALTPPNIGPLRATAAGLVTPKTMRNAFVLCFALALIPGAYIIARGGWPFLAIGLISIVSGVLYTGGPFPLGYLGLGDLFVLVFFGPVAVCGTYYLHAFTLSHNVIVASFAPGLISVALLTVNNLRDVDQDRVAGKRTLAVRFGRTFARVEYIVCLLIACALIPLYFALSMRDYWFVAAPLVCGAIAWPPLRAVLTKGDGPALNEALGSTGKLLLAFSFVFSLCWVL